MSSSWAELPKFDAAGSLTSQGITPIPSRSVSIGLHTCIAIDLGGDIYLNVYNLNS